MASIWDKILPQRQTKVSSNVKKQIPTTPMPVPTPMPVGGNAPLMSKETRYGRQTYESPLKMTPIGANMTDARTGLPVIAPTPQQPGFEWDLDFGFGNVLGTSTGGGGGYYTVSGGGGGGGAAISAYETMKKQQEELANKERANINARRDAAIQEIEKAYADQMAYLDTQAKGLEGSAASGRQSVTQQQQATIGTAQQQAEIAARSQRDVYKDLLLQGRRRARATGAGSSSGYQEITGLLDSELARNLGQVEQTKQNQIGVANNVADQAVVKIEQSLQSALAEIANNRATSLREKDSQANEVRMNAADALLEVDKWVTKAFSDIDAAKASMATGGGGGYTRRTGGGTRTNYTASQKAAQGQILNSLQQQLAQAQAMGQLTPQEAQLRFNQAASRLIGFGASGSDIKAYQGLFVNPYLPQQQQAPRSVFELYQQDPEAWRDYMEAQQQFNIPYNF